MDNEISSTNLESPGKKPKPRPVSVVLIHLMFKKKPKSGSKKKAVSKKM